MPRAIPTENYWLVAVKYVAGLAEQPFLQRRLPLVNEMMGEVSVVVELGGLQGLGVNAKSVYILELPRFLLTAQHSASLTTINVGRLLSVLGSDDTYHLFVLAEHGINHAR